MARVLSALFDDDQTTVDTTNHNAARIKALRDHEPEGDNTSDRPPEVRILVSRSEVAETSWTVWRSPS